MYSVTVSRRYAHGGVRCESNALLWLYTLECESTSRKDAMTPFSTNNRRS